MRTPEMAVHLRPARSTDAGKVGAILSEFIDQTPWMPRIHSRAEDVGFAGHMIDQGWVTVALIDRHLVGFLARESDMVQALYVARAAQRQRCGTALLQHAQSQTDTLSLWTFQANTAAQVFYEAHGFTAAERTQGQGNDEHLPDIRMTWQHRKGA